MEPAHKSDAHALIPAIESVKERNLSPKELLADSLYGSDDNCQEAKRKDVELIAPVMDAQKQKGVCLSDFKVSENGLISVCPLGQHTVKTKRKKNRFTASFDSQKCRCCPYRSQCPVKKGKRFYYLRYTNKDLRVAQRRAYEETPEFKDRYRWRSGIEGTVSEYDRRTGVKHLRVRGLKAVGFSATLKALAVNIFRAAALRLALEGKKEPGVASGLICLRLISIVKERFSAFMQIVKKNI